MPHRRPRQPVARSLLGSRVYIYPGARIGQEGFSFATTKSGFLSIPQLGRVIIEDDVEVGANSTIDRGSTHDTVIGAGSRLDNLVQIGHNVRLGRCCVIVAQVGIAGSTVLEDFVQVGGQAAMAGHLRIGAGSQIGAQAGVISDTAAGSILLGSPAQPRTDFFRQVATLKRIDPQAQVTRAQPWHMICLATLLPAPYLPPTALFGLGCLCLLLRHCRIRCSQN